jgi:hypothetical protein
MYTASLFEKANLRKHLESWRGRKFTDDELKEFELENLIEANCQIQVIHNIGNNGIVYANVQAIVPLAKGMTKMRISPDFVRKKDRKHEGPTRDPESGSDGPDDEDVPF